MATAEYNYLKGLCKGLKLNNATKALAYMLKYHEGQTRNDGSPYYVHPVKVAAHLASLDLFKDTLDLLDILLSGAILHDIREDTSVTKEMLVQEFNETIALVVEILSKINISDESYYNRFRSTGIEYLIATLIKIADRCNNVSTMAGTFTKIRLEKYIKETNELVKPLIRYTRDNYPEVSNQVVAMSYHINSVISAIQVMLPLMNNVYKIIWDSLYDSIDLDIDTLEKVTVIDSENDIRRKELTKIQCIMKQYMKEKDDEN